MIATMLALALASAASGYFLSRVSTDRARREEVTRTAREVAARVHDLRQPIQAIELYAAAMSRHVESEEARDMLARIHQAIAQAQDQLSSLAQGANGRAIAPPSRAANPAKA